MCIYGVEFYLWYSVSATVSVSISLCGGGVALESYLWMLAIWDI